MNFYHSRPTQQQQQPPPPPPPSTSISYDSSSVSSTASPTAKANSSMNFATTSAPNRSMSNLSPYQNANHPVPPLYTGYDSGSISPNEQAIQNFDSFVPDSTTLHGSAANHTSPALPHNTKRAYRQRRKDPSCDACRERKVKVTFCVVCFSVGAKQNTSVTQRMPQAVQSAQVGTLDANSLKKQTDECHQSSQ
jgi:hypothetical protein